MARKLITTAEFAEQARTPVATVRYWRHINYGPRGVRLGRAVVYDAAEVEAWIDEAFTDGAVKPK
jgi:predicted DNA-binding transcriptional regulator AlpA